MDIVKHLFISQSPAGKAQVPCTWLNQYNYTHTTYIIFTTHLTIYRLWSTHLTRHPLATPTRTCTTIPSTACWWSCADARGWRCFHQQLHGIWVPMPSMIPCAHTIPRCTVQQKGCTQFGKAERLESIGTRDRWVVWSSELDMLSMWGQTRIWSWVQTLSCMLATLCGHDHVWEYEQLTRRQWDL